MDAAQIRAIMEEGRFSDYGIRGLCFDEEYAVGDSPRESYDWDHENDISTYATDGRTLGGVCTVGLTEDNVEKVISLVPRMYGDGRMALIGGTLRDYGEDPGEWILSDAEILAIWEA